MGLIGGNAGHNFGGVSVAQCLAWGVQAVRFPVTHDGDPRPAGRALAAAGIQTLLCFPQEAFFDGDRQVKTIHDYQHELEGEDWLRHVQFGNEPDVAGGGDGSSWQQDLEAVNELIDEARWYFPRPRYKLIGPGLASGDTDYPAGLLLRALDGLGVHPYAREPRGQRVATRDAASPMLDRYAAFGLPIWATEYDSRGRGMGAYLAARPDVEAQFVFCLHNYAPFSVQLEQWRIDELMALTTEPQPPADPYYVGDGIRAILERKGWTALSNEKYFNDETSVTLIAAEEWTRFLYWSQTQHRAYLGDVLDEVP